MKTIATFLFIAFTSINFCLATVYHVSTTGNDANNGLTWATALADVQTAIDKAAASATADALNEVWIAAGTYKHNSQMGMKNNIGIYGDFAGTESAKDERIAEKIQQPCRE